MVTVKIVSIHFSTIFFYNLFSPILKKRERKLTSDEVARKINFVFISFI